MRSRRPADPHARWRRPGRSATCGVALAPDLTHATTVVAVITPQGVVVAEHESFTTILGLLPGATLVRVGHQRGEIGGSGGPRSVDARFEEVNRADVIAVPGALGVERLTRDARLLGWLRRVAPGARWIVTSSTGSVVLAAAGLAGEGPLATHWLAGPLLGRHGGVPCADRLRVDGRVVTASGDISAMEAARYVLAAETA